jgi:hypothetical protein
MKSINWPANLEFNAPVKREGPFDVVNASGNTPLSVTHLPDIAWLPPIHNKSILWLDRNRNFLVLPPQTDWPT